MNVCEEMELKEIIKDFLEKNKIKENITIIIEKNGEYIDII